MEKGHELIADFWNPYIKEVLASKGKLDAFDISQMMILMKMCRNLASRQRDNLVDQAGYVRCGAEILGMNKEAPAPAPAPMPAPMPEPPICCPLCDKIMEINTTGFSKPRAVCKESNCINYNITYSGDTLAGLIEKTKKEKEKNEQSKKETI